METSEAYRTVRGRMIEMAREAAPWLPYFTWGPFRPADRPVAER